MRWRVIVTDTESPTGVAPECPDVANHQDGDRAGVYDCCPGPHLELWNSPRAVEVAVLLTVVEADIAGS